MASSTIKLAEYLFTRLRQLDVESIHGVPGDYNLALLDYVEPQGLHWVGNCNELNAGYAADAYARVKGLGAIITTFGVGELSAANAIAGSYAELAPVVHIVGTPARHLQDSRALIHHTLNDGEYGRFAKMYEQITVAQASLWDPRTCPELIDSTILQCLIQSRPVYIQLPVDMVAVPVASERLQTKLEVPDAALPHHITEALELVLNRIYASRRPMILIDGESRAYDILGLVSELVKSTNWPTYTSIFGKSYVDESFPNVQGIWKGSAASEQDHDYVKSCDLVLCFGPHFSSTNTYRGSSIPDPKVSLLFKATSVEIGSQTFRDLPSKRFLSLLIQKLDFSKVQKTVVSPITNGEATITSHERESSITQDLFYRTFSQYLQPGDIILAETGTAGHGCRDFKLPPHTHLFKPSTWLSIGYMLPAAQGAALAQKELQSVGRWQPTEAQHTPRTVLLIGDGSFQMTVQELSTIIREQLNVLIILINNDGYTIERCLHGWNQSYNDVASWRYLKAPGLFGASEDPEAGYHSRTFQVRTWEDLERVFGDECMTKGPMLRMVEAFMEKEDAPVGLSVLLQQQKDAAGVK